MRTSLPHSGNEGATSSLFGGDAATRIEDAAQPRADLILSTLDKGLRILEVLAGDTGSGLTLTELARVLGMHRSTLFRFLATLRARGYVDRDPATDRYRLGAQALVLASAYLSRLDVRRVARPVLEALCDRTQELVHLTMLDQGDVITIDRIEGKQPVSLQTELGARRPAYCTASGKAILAYLPVEEVARILARGMPRHTLRTITTPEHLHEHLAEIRRCGYAVDDEERIEGVRCAAAPVFDFDGRIVGALSVAAPALRTPIDRLTRLGEEATSAAADVSRRLGFAGVPGC
jgi:DNA-binding IclR family transcriptional regulator